MSLYDPTFAPLKALPNKAGDLDSGGHFWVYGFPVSSLSEFATLNRDIFKRKEPGSAGIDEEEDKLDLWSGTCTLIANMRTYTGYPDVHLALVIGDDQEVVGGSRSSTSAKGDGSREGSMGKGAGYGEGASVMWAITLVCAKGRGRFEGRPTVGHLRKLEPILGRPQWFEALKDRKTFCFEV